MRVSEATAPAPALTAYLNADVATVEEQTPFAEVIDALITSSLKRVVVVDAKQRVKGIISDVDVLARLQEDKRPHLLTALTELTRGRRMAVRTAILRAISGQARVAADVMNRQVITILDTASVQEAIDVMMSTHHKVLPVIDRDSHLIGTVGRSDVLRILLESEAEP